MTELIEPRSGYGHAGGDIATEELMGHGHFVTHFDEPSIDFSGGPERPDASRPGTELRQIAARYPQARSALLPMLHLVQSVEGRVTPAGIEACAEILGITTADVSGVATFYTMYKRRPVGGTTSGSARPRCARSWAATRCTPRCKIISASATTRPPTTA